MRRNIFLVMSLFIFFSFEGKAQEGRWLNGDSAYVKWVSAALCYEDSPVVCPDVQVGYVDVVPRHQLGLVEPTRLTLAALKAEYINVHQLKQEAQAQAAGDEYLAHLYWERELRIAGRNKCENGATACYVISGIVAVVGGPKGIALGAGAALACYFAAGSCKADWENELYIIGRATAEYDKCSLGDKECYKRAFEKKNIKPQPLPTPLQVRQSNGSGNVGGISGSSMSWRGGGDSSGAEQGLTTYYVCRNSAVSSPGTGPDRLQRVCGWTNTKS